MYGCQDGVAVAVVASVSEEVNGALLQQLAQALAVVLVLGRVRVSEVGKDLGAEHGNALEANALFKPKNEHERESYTFSKRKKTKK